jgi:ATP-binding cassette subfamily F protein uup
VSHDRYFLDKLTDHLFIFEGDGKISDFNGNYQEYREWKKEKDKVNRTTEKTKEQPEAVKTISQKAKLSYKEQREFETLETEIPRLEGRKSEIIMAMNETIHHEKMMELARELEQINQLLDEKEMRWLELSERA